MHSKNSRVRFDPEKSLGGGPDPFWGQTYPESESERHFGLRFRSFLPGFQISLTQEWVWPHGTFFRVKSDLGVFRVWRLPTWEASEQQKIWLTLYLHSTCWLNMMPKWSNFFISSRSFKDVFSVNSLDFDRTLTIKHMIPLMDEHSQGPNEYLFWLPQRRIPWPPLQYQAVKEQLLKMEQAEVIHSGRSPYTVTQ